MVDAIEQYERQLNTGKYLADIRTSKNIRLTDAAHKIGITPAYLKEIENGSKLPSDLVIRSIAGFYEIPEDNLFQRWGKISLMAREQFEEMKCLQEVLSDMKKQKLSENQKQDFLDKVKELYKVFLNGINKDSNNNK